MNSEHMKSPPTMRKVTVIALVLTFIVGVLDAGRENLPTFIGAWLGAFAFCTLIPGLLAYIAGGRKKNWERNDRWFLNGFIVFFILLVAGRLATFSHK